MKWTFSIKNKLAASGALLALCLLVLLSNYLGRRYTGNVKNYMSTLYEDRLLAEAYILQLNSDLYQLKEIVHSNAPEAKQRVSVLLQDIKKFREAYEATKFTAVEKRKAGELSHLLLGMEGQSSPHLQADIAEALLILQELTAIQVSESKLIMGKTEKVFKSSEHSAEFAFAVTILILLVLQALVFASKTIRSSSVTSSLN